MKVLFFNYEYPPLGGGAGNASLYLLKEFSKMQDLEVDLVTSSIDADYHLEKIGERIRIHSLPIGKNAENLHFQSQKDLLIYTWRAFWFSRKLIKQNDFTLSHSFFTVPCGFLSLAYYWLYKLPYIVSLRGSDVPGYSDRFAFIYKILTPIIKLIWNKAAFVISNSQGLKDLAARSGTKKEISIIFNGIDINAFAPADSASDRFIITPGASRLTHRKGLKFLVEAVAILSPKYPQILLKIIGEGNAKNDLEELAKKFNITDKVEFVGRISHEKVSRYYQEASVFVLPSLNEGMSNAMLEALASGLPLIATDTGGSSELLQDNVNGFLINFEDSNDIAQKLETLINDRELTGRMGAASRKIAEGLSWTKVARQYFELYKKII